MLLDSQTPLKNQLNLGPKAGIFSTVGPRLDFYAEPNETKWKS